MYVHRDRIEPVRRYCIVGEGIAIPLSICDEVGCGIVNLILHNGAAKTVVCQQSAAGQRFTEVAVTVSGGGHSSRNIVRDGRLTEVLEIEKEERLVVAVVELWDDDWAAERESPIVSALTRPQQVAVAIIGKGCSRVEELIYEVLVGSAVPLVGTRPHCQIEQSATCLTKLGCIIAGLNCELLNRVHASLRLRLSRVPAVRRVLTLDPHGLRIRRQAVYTDIYVRGVGGTWKQLHHRVGVSDARRTRRCSNAHHRQAVHRVGRNRVAELTAFSF